MRKETRNPNNLHPHKKNPKQHTEEQIDHIANSIMRFGWTQPVVVDEQDTILVGHGRVLAAQKLQQEEIPVWVVESLNDTEKAALLVFDNSSNAETGFNVKKMDEIYANLAQRNYDYLSLGLIPQEIKGQEEGQREEDKSKLKESYDTYISGETKQIVLYYKPEDYHDRNERINKLMETEDIHTKSGLVKTMILDYEQENGLI